MIASRTIRGRRAAWALAALLAGLLPGTVSAQISWNPKGAFSDVQFTSLVSPAGFPCIVIFTGLQNGGVRASTDCGEQYATLLVANVYSVTAKNENIGYAAAGTAGILKTIDQGGAWFQVNDGLPGGADARSLVIHLGNPDSIFAGVRGAGVFAGGPSTGDAVQWTAINQGLLDLSVRTIERVRGGTFMLAATDGGIWRREGGVWSAVAPGVVANRFVIDSADSSRVYAATEVGVFRSTDAGRSFFLSSNGLPVGMAINDIARRTDRPEVLYVGTRGGGVYESIDFGQSWRVFGPPLPGDNDVRAILAAVQQNKNLARVFAGTRANGLYEAEYSTPAGETTWGRIKDLYR